MPADGILAARSHARISATPASRAATQNLTDFTGALYPQLGAGMIHGRRRRWVQMRKPRGGHMLAGLPSIADIARRAWHGAVSKTRPPWCADSGPKCGLARAASVGGDEYASHVAATRAFVCNQALVVASRCDAQQLIHRVVAARARHAAIRSAGISAATPERTLGCLADSTTPNGGCALPRQRSFFQKNFR
jgi:hypothetical protein